MNERMLELECEAQERYREEKIKDLRQFVLVEGTPGTCEYCGEHSPRLVNTACARCRDAFKLG